MATGLIVLEVWRDCELVSGDGSIRKPPDVIPNWVDGTYIVYTKAIDNTGTAETTPKQVQFEYDTQEPTSSIKMPNASWHRAFATISGTAKDPGNADAQKVEVLLRIDGGNYWDGDGFDSAVAVWSTTTLADLGSGIWQFNYPITGQVIPNWGSGGNQSANGDRIQVRSQVTDKSRNAEDPYQSLYFWVDVTTPTVLNLAPSTYTAVISNLPTISGTALDTPSTGKIDTVRIRIREASKPGDTTPNYWKDSTSAFDYTDTEGELAWFTV